MEKIFVTDGDQRASLAIVRALGRKKVPVYVGEAQQDFLSKSSRWIQKSCEYPSPSVESSAFLQYLNQYLIKNEIRVLIPVTDITTSLILRNRSLFKDVVIPFPSWENYDLLTDKITLNGYAKSLNIKCPETYLPSTFNDLAAIQNQLQFPVVVKPYKSKVEIEGRWNNVSVQYANNFSELKNSFCSISSKTKVIIQEKIEGPGVGLFVLFNNGQPVQFFAHERLRELPPSGGVSVYSQSIPVPEELKSVALKMLQPLNWHGLAMLEFKRNVKNNEHYLIEVNCRPWGSMNLSVASGVNFPYQLYQTALKESVVEVADYKTYRKNRWLFGDMMNLRLTLSEKRSLTEKMASIMKFILSFFRSHSDDVMALNDLGPFLFELKYYSSKALNKALRILGSIKSIILSFSPIKMLARKNILYKAVKAKVIVFVCRGNICRSPFAEYFARSVLPKVIKVHSFGYLPEFGRRSPDNTQVASQDFSIEIAAHRSKPCNADVLEEADLVFVFDYDNAQYLHKKYPKIRKKVFFLGFLSQTRSILINDPYGEDLDSFKRCFQNIATALKLLSHSF